MIRRRLRYQKKKLKALAWRAAMAFPKRVACNLCGWEGRQLMSDSWHPHTVCPRCASQVRHRLLAAALTELGFERIVRGKRVLHFSPEIMLGDVLRRAASTYQTADYSNPRMDLKLDITNMTSIADGAYDAVVACDILEHVADDRRAMAEIRRVLAPDGYAILTVPQRDHLATTFEDPSVTSPREREKHYGQHDHLRIYGDDFPQLLAGSGFDVTTVNQTSFPAAVVARHVLFPPVLSQRINATNHRKVFLGRRV